MAIFEGVCERGFGSTFALQFYPEYLDRHCAVPWVPDFFHAPIDQGLARLKMLAPPPGLLGPCLLSPFLLRLASSLRGERSRIALDLAGCPLLPATFGPPRPSAPVAERPADGLHLWRLLALHFRRRARAPRSAGGGPPGRSLDSTSYLLGRPRSSWATPWPYRFLCPREPLS